jgi:hypothetical protein
MKHRSGRHSQQRIKDDLAELRELLNGYGEVWSATFTVG